MAKLNRWWSDCIEAARQDMGTYEDVVRSARRRSHDAAQTASQIQEMHELLEDRDTLSADMMERYGEHLEDAYETVTDAVTVAEKKERMAEARTRYAQNLVERNDLSHQRPYRFRPETYGDILSDIEESLATVRTGSEDISHHRSAVEEACQMREM